jgi:uncharacterized protein YsxB (DUF464 family)
MVRVRMVRAPDGSIEGFSIVGHAGAGVRGQDVVCAGVSAIAQTAVLGLEQRLGLAPQVEAGEGRLTVRLAPGIDAAQRLRAQDILETMWLGLCAVAAVYPRHVQLGVARLRGPRGGPGAALRRRGGRWAQGGGSDAATELDV